MKDSVYSKNSAPNPQSRCEDGDQVHKEHITISFNLKLALGSLPQSLYFAQGTLELQSQGKLLCISIQIHLLQYDLRSWNLAPNSCSTTNKHYLPALLLLMLAIITQSLASQKSLLTLQTKDYKSYQWEFTQDSVSLMNTNRVFIALMNTNRECYNITTHYLSCCYQPLYFYVCWFCVTN